MKKMTELIRFVSMPVFSVIFVAVLILDAALFQSMSTNMETNIRETGEARLAWIEQSLERYVTITTVMEGRVKESEGRTVPDQTKLADFVKMDNALRSIQIVQEDGTFTGYNQDADIRNFTNPETGSLKKLALEARRSGNVGAMWALLPPWKWGRDSGISWWCGRCSCLMEKGIPISGATSLPL